MTTVIAKNMDKKKDIELKEVKGLVSKDDAETQKQAILKAMEASIKPQEFYAIPIESITYVEPSEDHVVWMKVNEENMIREGTLNVLIQELTSHVNYDSNFIDIFLLTYKTFCTPDTLFDMLVERYNIPPPVACTVSEFTAFQKEKLNKVRIRCVTTFKFWIENYYHDDFEKDDLMKQKLNQFFDDLEKIKGGLAHKKPIQNAMAKQESPDAVDLRKTRNIDPKKCPKIEKPGKLLKIGGRDDITFTHPILEWPSIEIARQIALYAYSSFKKIEPKEMLNENWNKGNREKNAPNIDKTVKFFNSLSSWVSSAIVQQDDKAKRTQYITKFIYIAERLNEIGDFNSMFSIFSGLTSRSIYRLKDSWNGLHPYVKSSFEKLLKLITREKDFEAIRLKLKTVKPPCIPYIGLYLTGLSFIERDYPKYVSGKINFVKCRAVWIFIFLKNC
jgi:son of sevenless